MEKLSARFPVNSSLGLGRGGLEKVGRNHHIQAYLSCIHPNTIIFSYLKTILVIENPNYCHPIHINNKSIGG